MTDFHYSKRREGKKKKKKRGRRGRRKREEDERKEKRKKSAIRKEGRAEEGAMGPKDLTPHFAKLLLTSQQKGTK